MGPCPHMAARWGEAPTESPTMSVQARLWRDDQESEQCADASAQQAASEAEPAAPAREEAVDGQQRGGSDQSNPARCLDLAPRSWLTSTMTAGTRAAARIGRSPRAPLLGRPW